MCCYNVFQVGQLEKTSDRFIFKYFLTNLGGSEWRGGWLIVFHLASQLFGVVIAGFGVVGLRVEMPLTLAPPWDFVAHNLMTPLPIN